MKAARVWAFLNYRVEPPFIKEPFEVIQPSDQVGS